MYYELDWDYKLSKNLYCETADLIDPCFGTLACICDNDFFRIAGNMPERPSDFDDSAEVFNVLKMVEQAYDRGQVYYLDTTADYETVFV